jgi:aspartate racemase
MTLHIGIVACSAEGASLCYRTICTEGAALMGRPHAHPEVSMHTPPLADTMDCIYRDDWRGVADIMLAGATKLAAIGADFFICPDNTIHQALPHVLPRSPKPWLHIADSVAAEAKRRCFGRIGLTGTKWLVDSDVYPRDYVRPSTADKEAINRTIMDELVCGVFKPEAVDGRHEAGRLRRRRARLHRDPAHHERLELTFAHAGLDTIAGTRSPAARHCGATVGRGATPAIVPSR